MKDIRYNERRKGVCQGCLWQGKCTKQDQGEDNTCEYGREQDIEGYGEKNIWFLMTRRDKQQGKI